MMMMLLMIMLMMILIMMINDYADDTDEDDFDGGDQLDSHYGGAPKIFQTRKPNTDFTRHDKRTPFGCYD